MVLFFLVLFIIDPYSFSAEGFADFISLYGDQMMIAYAVLSIIRGLFLIPSTPFIIAGAMLFPEQPLTVFIISIIGVLTGSTFVYYFSDLLGFSGKLEKKYPKQIEKWNKRLNSKWAVGLVIAWSFFPLVPTDVICYVAGVVKMKYRNLIFGVLIGELVLVYLYVYLGQGLFELIF